MTNVIQVKSYQRRKAAPVTFLDTTEALYPPGGLQHVLATDLDERLSEPLDAPQFDDLSADDKQRMREGG